MWTVEKESNEVVYTLASKGFICRLQLLSIRTFFSPLYSESLLHAISPGISPFSTIQNNVSSPDCRPLTVLPILFYIIGSINTQRGFPQSTHCVTHSRCLNSVSDSAPPP